MTYNESPWTLPASAAAEVWVVISAAANGSDGSDGTDGLLAAAAFVVEYFAGREVATIPVGLSPALSALSKHLDTHRYDDAPADIELLTRNLKTVLAITTPVSAPTAA